MQRATLIQLFVAIAGFAALSAKAAGVPSSVPDRPPRAFHQIRPIQTITLTQQLPINHGVTVINGMPAEDVFSASFYTYDKSACSSTLIGPRTVLTAAHCFDDDNLNIRLTVGHDDYKGPCFPAPTSRDASESRANDIAICELTHDVLGVPYDVVDLLTTIPNGRKMLLTGFGCDHLKAGRNKRDKPIFRVGWTHADSLDSVHNQIVTTIDNGVSLCYGDSGGGVYDELQSPPRRVIAVNASIGDGKHGVPSRVTPLYVDAIAQFVKSHNGICGADLAPGSHGCRS